MRRMIQASVLCGVLGVLCAGCASTEQVDPARDRETTVSFDYRDLQGAAAELTEAFLESGRIGGTAERPWVIAFGRMDNDTCQHLDLDALTGQLSEAFSSSDRFEISSTMAARASNRDQMVAEARTARGNAEFNQQTVQAEGQLKAPDLSITGKLTQRNVRRDNGGTRVEYFLALQATRLSDGVVVWQKSYQVIKSVARGMPVW